MGRMDIKRKDTRAAIASADGKYGEPQMNANGDLRTRDDDLNTALTTLNAALVTANAYLASLAGVLTLTAGAEGGDSGISVTIQGGAWRQIFRVWLAETDLAAPSATGNTTTVTTGTIQRTATANADYDIISDASGTAVVKNIVAGAATRFLMAEVAGRTYSLELTYAA